jgi:hypothetical protein
MAKTIVGTELNAQLDRLVTEQRQLMRKFKALEAASCEKESEAEAFYMLLAARFESASTEDEAETAKKVFAGRAITTDDSELAAAAAEMSIDDEAAAPAPNEPSNDGEDK